MCALGVSPKRGGASHFLMHYSWVPGVTGRALDGLLVHYTVWVTAWVEYQQHKDRQAFKLLSQGLWLKVSLHILSLLSVKNKGYLLGMGYLHSSLWAGERGWTFPCQYLAEGLSVIGSLHCVMSQEDSWDAFKGVSAVQRWTKADGKGCFAIPYLSPFDI